MFCALCATVCRCMLAVTLSVCPQFTQFTKKTQKQNKTKPCLLVSLIMVPLNSLFTRYKTAKHGRYQRY